MPIKTLFKSHKHLYSKGFTQGVFWTLSSCLLSTINDVLMKYTSSHLSSFQIVFFRSFTGLLISLPFFLTKRQSFKTRNPLIHISRILVGSAAITLACYSTSILSLAEVTVLSFCQPLLFLPAAVLFLKEKLTLSRILANLFGFLGVIIVLNPESDRFLSLISLIPIASASLFAGLDIITKKSSDTEHPLLLIFYFNLGVTLLTGTASIFTWQTPSINELILLLFLGISATLIQLSSFFALFSSTILSLAPLRYAELLFSCILSILLFREWPVFSLILGSSFIIGGVLYASWGESSTKKQTEPSNL